MGLEPEGNCGQGSWGTGEEALGRSRWWQGSSNDDRDQVRQTGEKVMQGQKPRGIGTTGGVRHRTVQAQEGRQEKGQLAGGRMLGHMRVSRP